MDFYEEDEAYTSFAWVYDMLMDNIPYDEWTSYLLSLLQEYGVSDGLVLDMGCGTGNMTERLAAAGYDMIGIDNSADMLMEAQTKAFDHECDILYLNQDMRSFELYGTVRACVSICDSMNYVTDYEDLVQVFKLVNNYLDPKGVFIFDYKTRYQFETLMGNRTIAENREECSFIWENSFDPVDSINIYDLTLFIEEEDGLFTRTRETHYQKAWTIEELKSAAKAAGMEYIAHYSAFTKDAPKEEDGRCYCVFRECGK